MIDADDRGTGTTADGAGRAEPAGPLGPVDLLAALALALAALATRWTFPGDGWFYDDAWQALAARAPIGDLPTVGQTQPGFTALLMAWSRLTGWSDTAPIGPALAAGVLGPPVLLLWLRRLRFGPGTSMLLSAALVVAPIHIRLSGRVKAYTAELLVVVAVAWVLPRMVASRWRPATAAAWAVAACLLATFSSFALLTAAAAGLVVLLHPQGDLRVRLPAVTAQGLASLALLRWTRSTYDAEAVAEQWRLNGAMLEGSLSGLPLRLADHAHDVVAAYPGGPRWFTLACLAVAAAGTALAAWRGPNRVTARFLALGTLLAVAGSILGSVPFGPPQGDLRRVSLWLFPAVAFGLASAATPLLARLPAGRPRWLADVAMAGGAAALVVTGLGHREAYWSSGAREASATVASEMGPGEAVWVTRLTAYSFALHSGLPYDLEARPEGLVGFVPVMHDERIVLLGPGTSERDLAASLVDADRVTVVNAPVGRNNTQVMFDLSVTLKLSGFERSGTRTLGTTTVTSWHRTKGAIGTPR